MCGEDSANQPLGDAFSSRQMALGRRCPEQCRLQAPVGTDGSTRDTGLWTCKEGSCHRPALEDPAGANSCLLSEGAGGRLKDHPSG